MSGGFSEQARLALKTSRENLHHDFDPVLGAAEVDAVFDDSISRLRGGGKIDDYIPALSERLTRERLKAVAQHRGLVKKKVPQVLFVAQHDTGRGQMGAALMQQLAGGRVDVQSAGTLAWSHRSTRASRRRCGSLGSSSTATTRSH